MKTINQQIRFFWNFRFNQWNLFYNFLEILIIGEICKKWFLKNFDEISNSKIKTISEVFYDLLLERVRCLNVQHEVVLLLSMVRCYICSVYTGTFLLRIFCKMCHISAHWSCAHTSCIQFSFAHASEARCRIVGRRRKCAVHLHTQIKCGTSTQKVW